MFIIDKNAYGCYNRNTPKREAGLYMIAKKELKTRLGRIVFGCFFVIMGILGIFSGMVASGQEAYAIPEETVVVDDATNNETQATEENLDTEDEVTGEVARNTSGGDSCKDSLGAIGWLVCPTTGKIAEAVDWLYDKIEEILVINPISMEDGSPIYEIWKYCRGITNIVFIIFLLVVIYSQLTGLGISNYGLKKVLPKLIVTAVLVNLSFLICSLAVDVSNIVGNGLRGIFTGVEESVMANGVSPEIEVSYSSMYSSLAGGTALAVGTGVVAFEFGAIWMLIPVVLGAIVAVVSGLITIALRQAVVVLLIMISPLAMVANILPNVEQWFKKWKDLLIKMLVFYPMFSLLFGASSLAGFAIILSAKSGFGILLGVAVQIFPLFFSWSLMKMSGTFLGDINAKMRAIADRPLAANRAWAESRMRLSKQKHLLSERAYTPSLRLMQFVNKRKIAREAEISEKEAALKERGLAYRARQNYKKGNIDGTLSKKGEEAYELQARVAGYQRIVLRDKNNFNKGFDYRAKKGTVEWARLRELDRMNIEASDALEMEKARGEKIDYNNAAGFHSRMEDAINAHFDAENVGRSDYKRHKISDRTAAEVRYEVASRTMEGDISDIQYAAATAAQAYDTQKKIVETKMQKYFELTPPTRDIEYRLGELTKNENAIANIDSIIAGMRILNQRGDTDLLRQQMENVLSQGVELGTHASQALAGFLMFEVKDSDPWLRRFGKYINLETANVYNKNNRQEMKVTYDEYIKGYHKEPNGEIMYAKRPMAVLMEGTSLDGIERTALSNFDDSLIEAYSYVGEDGKKHLNVDEYLKKREEIQKSIGPQFISASLKYLAGSEQLKSAVSFLTGYSYSQVKDENGKAVLDDDGNVKYEWKARWDKGGDLADDPKAAREYFEKKSLQYFKDQTPTQILGLRSDYRDPLMEHLSEAFMDESEEGEQYRRKISEIQTKYGDLPAEEASRKRKAEVAKLKMDMAGKQVRKILGKSGKLEQIYRTRRSGAANNAKDWLREWVSLDDEEALFREVNRYKNRKVEGEREKRSDSDNNAKGDSDRVYNSEERKKIRDRLEKLWEDREEGMNAEEFYNEAIEAIRSWFGGNTETIIEKEFRKSYERRVKGGHPEAYDLKKDLEDLLMDADNYPDA